MTETSAPAPKLSAPQRAVLTALAAGHFVPIRANRRVFAHACNPATAIKLHELGLVEVTESTRYRDGRRRAVITSVTITEAGRAAVAPEEV